MSADTDPFRGGPFRLDPCRIHSCRSDPVGAGPVGLDAGSVEHGLAVSARRDRMVLTACLVLTVLQALPLVAVAYLLDGGRSAGSTALYALSAAPLVGVVAFGLVLAAGLSRPGLRPGLHPGLRPVRSLDGDGGRHSGGSRPAQGPGPDPGPSAASSSSPADRRPDNGLREWQVLSGGRGSDRLRRLCWAVGAALAMAAGSSAASLADRMAYSDALGGGGPAGGQSVWSLYPVIVAEAAVTDPRTVIALVVGAVVLIRARASVPSRRELPAPRP
ncbi:hypothetical protein [Terrabacter carboxydivorans]|uniref:Uncharacterized protein n=1 Tax=Terrabacter carboxydivorans TaxID=619730 RepID=A0ABP5YFB5_9MICO